MLGHPIRRRLLWLHLLLMAGLLLTPLPVRAQETPVATPLPVGEPDAGRSEYTLGQCRSIEGGALRSEIEAAALAVIGGGSNNLDIEGIVDRKWAELNVDAVVDAEVGAAVAALANETGYWQRLLSGWSAARAEEFATEIAGRAFASESFNARLSDLSYAIGEEIARSVNAELARAASAAFLCLRDYVGAAYSDTLFAAFQESVSRRVEEAGVQVDSMALGIDALDVHVAGIAGAGVIVITEVGRRVSTKISEKLAQRVAGKVVGRVAGRAGSSLLPVIGWVVGIGLIVWDLYEGGQGALPQIEEALTSEEVKAKIRSEVADAVRASLPEEATIAALETAVSMLEEWDTFCGEHRMACTMAGESQSFRDILATLPLSDLPRLDALLDAFDRELGQGALERALDTAQFDQLLALPASAAVILAETRSVESTLAWAALAQGNLDQVAANGIHRRILPSETDPDGLYTLLVLNDGQLVQKFLTLDLTTRGILWPLATDTLRELLSRLSETELAEFATALALQPPDQHSILANDYLAGAISLEQLRATPTAATLSVPTSSPAALAPSATENAPAGMADASITGAPIAGTTPLPTGTPATVRAGSGRANPYLLAGLGTAVAILAIVAAALWMGAIRKREE